MAVWRPRPRDPEGRLLLVPQLKINKGLYGDSPQPASCHSGVDSSRICTAGRDDGPVPAKLLDEAQAEQCSVV